ncbi:unnamed protein product [Darwinula stevensoni]|uniref:DUF7869 domain-containing protein n=1 Tax=Darwinula stevensoni TaxID=69355 RepID=A0A7R8X9N8_9CRUS|nr:unnamed protein product [Darwinula stevensoni]CAG0891300.1 unnamed protein product [Darwinula stevensoni]
MKDILRTLLHVKEYLKPKLFLQNDNRTKENENKYLCALAHLLVEEGIFEEVIFNFHPVGHTHEDIDQLFSSVDHYLRVRDTCTVNDLMTCLLEIRRRGRPENLYAEEFNAVRNFKTVIQDHFPRNFRGQTKPHSFRFRKSKGITQMHFRLHAGEAWCPNEHDIQYMRECLGPDLGYVCLQTTPALNAFGVLVPPDWNAAGLEVVRASIQKDGCPHHRGLCLKTKSTLGVCFLQTLSNPWVSRPFGKVLKSGRKMAAGSYEADHPVDEDWAPLILQFSAKGVFVK